MADIIAHLDMINKNMTSPAYKKLDLTRLAVAGHSRGGKMAALHFATGKHVLPHQEAIYNHVIAECSMPCNAQFLHSLIQHSVPSMVLEPWDFGDDLGLCLSGIK